MRARYLLVAGAVFAGGMVSAASGQEGKPFDAVRAALNSLTSRVASLEQETSTISQLVTGVASLTTSVTTLTSSETSLEARVSALEQRPPVTSDLTIADADGRTIGRAMFNGNSTYAVMFVDGVAAAFQVGDAGFRQAVAAPTAWYQSTDCAGNPFLANDTGVIRLGQVVGTAGVYASGRFGQMLLRSRRAYPSGTCSALTFNTTAAELGTVDLSTYRGPFSVME